MAKGWIVDVEIALEAYTLEAWRMARELNAARQEQPRIVLPPLPVSESDQAIIAHRIWRLVPAGAITLLQSVSQRDIWPVGEPIKAHELKQRQVDVSTHHSGIHAFKTPQTPGEYLASYSLDDPTNLVRGTVKLWGRVIEHKHGYRAEFAYPDVVIVQDRVQAQALRRTYGCEVVVESWRP